MLFYTEQPAVGREKAVGWLVDHMGLPEGFSSQQDYECHVDLCLNDSGFDEVYLKGGRLLHEFAYVATTISVDVHRKGFIMDVTDVVISPDAPEGAAKAVVNYIQREARKYGCAWISRCKHLPNGDIVNTFRRTNHG